MISRLNDQIKKKNAPVVVGLDPMLSYVPEHIVEAAVSEYGETLDAAGEAIWQYNKAIVDATYELIPAVKPQIAMYEQFGIPGVIAFERTVSYCQEKGLIVIGDVKRGDIGSTSEAYANGHIGSVRIGGSEISGFHEDIITVNPYLGSDGVKPFVNVCKEKDKGIFVLVKTSNPSSGEFQDRQVIVPDEGDTGEISLKDLKSGSRPLYELVAEKVNEWGLESMDGKYSNVGAVVGATYPEMGKALRKLMPHAYILVPGYGAQGGTANQLRPYFDEDGAGAIVNSSRGIICAYKQEKYAEFGDEGFADASRQAVVDMIEDIRSIF
ncbi:MAG TPA: orotidine-5'-phosphate decarboxylase [Lachnospiraceae bacterium]|nr:orotidine-5'-phosphate decarboxylase [Lachnospiraceae bacterium]